MLPELWTPNLKVVFVGTAVTELSNAIGFYHLHPRDRFWELLALGSITPEPVITAKERKALIEGHRAGSVSDPVRVMFIEKKIGQLERRGIGLTDMNRRVIAADEKDRAAKPSEDDLRTFLSRAGELKPALLAFVTGADLFVDLFSKTFPTLTAALGREPFTIGSAEVWLLGSTTAVFRGESLTRQEDAFFALGERLESLRMGTAQQ